MLKYLLVYAVVTKEAVLKFIDSFGEDLQRVAQRFARTFGLLDGVTAAVVDLYAKVNAALRTDQDRCI